MAAPIRIRARAKDGVTDVLVLMPHPMETGLRKDESGRFVPAHFITDVRVQVAGRPVLEARMSIAVAADPLLNFRVRGARPGDKVEVHWTDSRGQHRHGEALVS